MKVFVWKRVDTVSGNYHTEGGVVAFAETEERAREIANVGGCEITPEEKPAGVREVIRTGWQAVELCETCLS